MTLVDFREPLSTEPLSTEPLSTEPLSTEPLSTEPLLLTVLNAHETLVCIMAVEEPFASHGGRNKL